MNTVFFIRSVSELHFHSCLCGFLNLRIGKLPETRHRGNQAGREHLNLAVHLLCDCIVVLPGIEQALLDFRKLLLKIDKAGIGLKVRIALGECEQGLKRS